MQYSSPERQNPPGGGSVVRKNRTCDSAIPEYADFPMFPSPKSSFFDDSGAFSQGLKRESEPFFDNMQLSAPETSAKTSVNVGLQKDLQRFGGYPWASNTQKPGRTEENCITGLTRPVESLYERSK